MHYSTILLGALTAPLALATPIKILSRQSDIPDGQVEIKLRFGDPTDPNNPNTDTIFLGQDDTVSGKLNLRQNVEINFGAGVSPDLRCKAIAIGGEAIIVQRGENIDDTFAPGAAGAWTFISPSTAQVQEIICDPTFQKADPEDSDIVLELIRPVGTPRGIAFRDAIPLQPQLLADVDVPDEWNTVTLKVGRLVEKQDLRCQISDAAGNIITLNRGQNLNKQTFSDGGQAAPWSFADPASSQVSKVECNSSFQNI
jgi:hypothetical protein